jgi:hypothetical protein
MMFDYLIEDNPKIDIPADWIRFIKDLIRGRPKLSLCHDPSEKPYLFHIVANLENGFDVDKCSNIIWLARI